jgi:hypothetical protein
MSGRILFVSGFLCTYVAGAFKYCNEHSGTLERRKFLDELKTCYLLRKDSARWSKLHTDFWSSIKYGPSIFP